MFLIVVANLLVALCLGQQYDNCRVPAVCSAGNKIESVWISMPSRSAPTPTPKSTLINTTLASTAIQNPMLDRVDENSLSDAEKIKRLKAKVALLTSPGWKNVGNGYQYWVSKNRIAIPYSYAVAICRNFNAKIATVGIRNNVSREYIVKNILRRVDVGAFWFGYRDNKKEGTFVWNDGQPQGNNPLDWADHQPDNRNNDADCAVLARDKNYKWDDYPCEDANSGVLCERYVG